MTTTPGGTQVFEMDRREYRDFLERECQRATDLDVESFVRLYLAGALDDCDVGVSEMTGLLLWGAGEVDWDPDAVLAQLAG